jgi:acetyl-CoA carboxylase carboxyl transferase subunit beta
MPLVDQPDSPHEDLIDLDLACPACGANLVLDDTFLAARVCGTCRRHFSISARERIGLLADPGSFEEFMAPAPIGPDGLAPELVPSAERLAEIRDRQVMTEAIVTGSVRIGGIASAIIVLDDHLVGSSLGATLVEKIIEALAQATGRKMPIVLVCTGGARTPAPGPLSVVQPARLASAFAQVHVAGLPVLGVLVHPVAASIHAMLATHTDILLAEPGARIGTVGSHPDAPRGERALSAEQLLSSGWIDDVVNRLQLRAVIAHALDLLVNPGSLQPVNRHGYQPAHPGSQSDSGGAVPTHPNRPDARGHAGCTAQ